MGSLILPFSFTMSKLGSRTLESPCSMENEAKEDVRGRLDRTWYPDVDRAGSMGICSSLRLACSWIDMRG